MPARLQIYLSDSEEKELLGLSHDPKVPERTRLRAEVLRLNHQKWTVKKIALWSQWSENTVKKTLLKWLF